MSGTRLALIADDPRLGGAVAAHLKKLAGPPPLTCKSNAICERLGPDTNGVLLLAVASPADVPPFRQLIQEVRLRRLPPALVLIEGEDLPRCPELEDLEPWLACRLRWPNADVLAGLLRERLARARPFFGTDGPALTEVIRHRLLAQTPSLLPLVERIALAATHEVTVLLTGETGTGKTFLARLMHDTSPRQAHPFLTVPCGAQPANLVESAFFGHVRGAFTGADRAKVGKFAAAGDGTILLDEIDTLGLEQQASLLRVIETGEYEPVGSNETQRCTARIIVASNWDLDEAVEQGRFRQDLYYRLNVMSFHLPPLRERVQDIAPLVRGIAARYNAKFRKDLIDVTPEAMGLLDQFPWPGNIRQLENVVQQAVLVSSGRELRAADLPPAVRDYVPPATNGNGHHTPESLVRNREQLERSLIQRALANNGYSRTRAAHALGISRVTLYKKMEKYGLNPTRVRPGTV